MRWISVAIEVLFKISAQLLLKFPNVVLATTISYLYSCAVVLASMIMQEINQSIKKYHKFVDQ